MPELPEVETVVNDLRAKLIGARLKLNHSSGNANVFGKMDLQGLRLLEDFPLIALSRLGKYILLIFDGVRERLVFHLGMTGQLYWRLQALTLPVHTHLAFDIANTHFQLLFVDPRTFGKCFWAKPIATDNGVVWNDPRLAKLGPDALEMTFDLLTERLNSNKTWRHAQIKNALLDQAFFAGIGNIYASEILFAAGISPFRQGQQLDVSQRHTLARETARVLRNAVAARGSSLQNYIDGSGQPGRYQLQHQVYGRAGAPCKRCTHPVQSTMMLGRSTFWCEMCQK